MCHYESFEVGKGGLLSEGGKITSDNGSNYFAQVKVVISANLKHTFSVISLKGKALKDCGEIGREI